MLQLYCRADCDDDPFDDLIIGVGMSTLPETSDAGFFYPCLKSFALQRDTEIVALFQNIDETGPLPSR